MTSSPGTLAQERAAFGTALVIVDMISCWDFEDAPKLLAQAHGIAANIAKLAHRCRRAGIPVIFANDNRGRWRSDFGALVDLSILGGGRGMAITQMLLPEPTDYFILKPKHSIFHATPMRLLLQHLHADRLILTGVSSDQCLLTSVSEARMMEFEVVVPPECAASQSPARHRVLVDQLRDVWKVDAPALRRLRFNRKEGRRA